MSDNQTSLEAPGPGILNPVGVAAISSRPVVEHRSGRRRGDRIILASGVSQRAVDQASALARSGSALLILGPSGSGRQHFARAIHEWSQRAGGPLVVVPGGGTPEGLQAREIFGATPEADPLSTGGYEGGLVHAAEGTLVIERIDLLSQAVRRRVAEVLRDGVFRREGSNETTALRTRIIGTADTHAENALSGITAQTLKLASLAERAEDILPLAAHFLAEFAEEAGVSAVGFTVDARRWLVEESWLGNVRELRERIRQAVRLSGSGSVSAEALMLSTEGDEVPSFKEAKRAFETRYVEGLLRRCSGNISRAARLAKKDRKDFYDVIRRTGVDPTQFRS